MNFRLKNSNQTSFYQPPAPIFDFFLTNVYQNSKMFDKLFAKKINSNLFFSATKLPAPIADVFLIYVYQNLKMFDKLHAKKIKSNLFL
jgi:hypothetical protein